MFSKINDRKSMIVIIIIVLLLCCSLSSGGIGGGLYYLGDKQSKNWDVVSIDNDTNVIGRLNNLGDAECMAQPESPGCYIVSTPEGGDLDKLDTTIRTAIETYPMVEIEGLSKAIVMENYSCGKNSTNERMWRNTGYDNPDDICYKIKNGRSITNEIKKILSEPFGKV